MSLPYDLHASLGYQLTLLSRINERKFEQNLAPLGLTRVKWCVLLAVQEHGLKNPSDIAEYIGIDRTATSRALRALDSDGLISRCSGADDKRMTEVALTDQGHQVLGRSIDAAKSNANHFTDKLSWYERTTLTEIINKLMKGETRDVSGL
ncbi:MAG: DNA-binding MarR family transcriptional regulator [Paracoccaceae bacterium]|jgi:DNA-binding MarR family transcriptional regulator